ncbi:hypothetical protein AB0G54_29865 [Streptomyces yokosukanensis]|uniref:hypothetical protein n=1 Tax=Streptomyces yokosukanensis TaxID=67386 RepID=UPI003447BECE
MSPAPLPPVAEPFQLPFHYGALHMIGVDYLVDPEPVRATLAKHHPALAAADFAGRALVSLNYQLYFAQYAFGGGITQEIEINIIAHPADAGDRVPDVTYAQYAQGWDQTRLLGIARIHVLCDNPLAIDAGRRLYAEPKHPGWFEVHMPSPNGDTAGRWNVLCKHAETAAGDTLERRDTDVFSLTADLAGLPATPVNNTPITGYGTTDEGRALAGPMVIHQPGHWHPLDTSDTERVRVTVHDETTEAGQDLVRLIGEASPSGAWTYQSAPVAAHQRPYYLRTGPAEVG